MFSEIINELANDLALEGEDGLSWNDFWSQLEKLIKKTTEKISLLPIKWDSAYKKLIWNFIKENKKLLFYGENDPVHIESITFEQAENMIMRIKTTSEFQNSILYGVLKPGNCKLSDKHTMLLRHIAKKKHEGITQLKLSDELSMDPRAVFYYLKGLFEVNLIIRKSVYILKKATYMIYFHQFVPEDKIKNKREVDTNNTFRIDLLDTKILDLLKNAENNMMALSDIISKLGFKEAYEVKWIQTRIRRFHRQGILERVKANDGSTTALCVRLPSSSTSSPMKVDESSTPEPSLQFPKVYRDLPFEYQIYHFILESDEKGAAKQDFIKRFPNLKWTFINAYLDNICDTPEPKSEQYLIYRIEELEGKVRQFRYFSSSAYRKLERNFSEISIEMSENDNKNNNKRQREQDPSIVETPPSDQAPIIAQVESPTKQQRIEITEQQQEKSQPGEKRKRSPETALPSPSSSEPVKKRTPKKKPTKINTTKLRRQQTILDLLEKNHVCEVTHEFFCEFNKIQEAAGDQKMARKTFRNMTNDMSSEGKLKLVTTDVFMKFGMTEYKTFLLHHSLDENSKEFTDVLESYKVGWNTPSHKQVREVQRISVDKTPSEDPEKYKNTYVANLKHAVWKPIATEHGWIVSKWLRVREVHRYLFTRALKIRHQNPIVLEGSDLVSLMPLDLLIKIFATLSLDTEMQEFIKSDANRALCLKELPDHIQNQLAKVNQLLRKLILSNLDALEALELIKQRKTDSTLTFEIKQEGHIYDYSKSPPTLLETVIIQNMEDVDTFWSKLKDYFVKIYPFLVDKTTFPFPFVKPHPLWNISTVRTWFAEATYSDYQKSSLNSFVDYENESTPSSNKQLMLYLSKQLRMPLERVKSYYLSLDAAFKKKQDLLKIEEARKKRAANQASSVIQSLMDASVKKQKVETSNKKVNEKIHFLEPTFVGSRRFRSLRVKIKSSDGINSGEANNGQIQFSQLEKDILLLSYVIMRVRAKNSIFYWSPIKQILENRDPEKCRRVMFHLVRSSPNLRIKIQRYQEKWEFIYKRGIQNKDIIDEYPWDTTNFDLRGYLEYFILNMQDNMTSEEDILSIKLPKKNSLLKDRFHISPYKLNSQKQTVQYKHCAMTLHFCESTYDVPNIICRNNTQSPVVEKVAIIIKMLMMLPPEIYKPEEAYEVMKQYPEDTTVRATHLLQDEGVVVKAKEKRGRIPGRMLRISERFITLATGILPFGFFDEASTFFSKIENNKTMVFSDINGVDMACLLSLISQYQVDMDIKDRQKYIRLRKGCIYPKLSAVGLCRSFIQSGLDITVTPKYTPTFNQEKKTIEATTNPVNDITKELQILESQEPDVVKVYQTIKDFGVMGASIDEIVQKFKQDESTHILKCCELLALHAPPIIKLVGSRQMRYVTCDFVSEYMVQTTDSSKLMEPWMWCDMSGNILSPVLKGCMQAVVSHILQRPGISLAQLKEAFDCFFTSYELHSVLEYLEKLGAIKCIKMRIRNPKMSLFGKRNVPSLQKTKLKCGNEISHYWLTPDYYAKI